MIHGELIGKKLWYFWTTQYLINLLNRRVLAFDNIISGVQTQNEDQTQGYQPYPAGVIM